MNDADLVKQVNDSLSPGYEVCGYGLLMKGDLYVDGGKAVGKWTSGSPSECDYIKVKKSFVWPKWLKGRAIAKDKDGTWNVHFGHPKLRGYIWTAPGEYREISPEFLDLDLPEVDWKDSLILNPNHPENKE